MKKLSVKSINSTIRYILPDNPIKRIYKNNFSGFLLSDGTAITGCCCNCKDKPCIKYHNCEFYSEVFNSFPHNSSARVCPNDALKYENLEIKLDSSKCIGCGICLYRCPYSAIAYDSNRGKCFIQQNEFKKHDTISKQDEQIEKFSKLPKYIAFNDISLPFITDDSLNIADLPDFSDILVRNFLINMGLHCNSYAKGNQHNRISFFAEKDGLYIIGENETSNDTLSVSRRLLDDLAVLISRYSIPANKITPIAVLNRLPNKRTDYYEVIEDIKKVLDIQISTITFSGLFILNLFSIYLSIDEFKSFILNKSNTSIVPYLQKYIPNISSICKYVDLDYLLIIK